MMYLPAVSLMTAEDTLKAAYDLEIEMAREKLELDIELAHENYRWRAHQAQKTYARRMEDWREDMNAQGNDA